MEQTQISGTVVWAVTVRRYLTLHAATDATLQGYPVGFETALYIAADEGSLDIVKFLLEHGAAPNIPGQNFLLLSRGLTNTAPRRP